ncbi:class I SAM-dependent DNA methyltransferase [Phyllobacterium zundukense]|uniref:SAM-dependent methyltransferase n=1 Tax=Phyllobacterium zundukense TaxID=1867719 RepID=A0A2N9VSB9_9HYPH|nr:methyltransferase domain-containing protein [Phyllobacterium zundukense]ATU92808.1 SAM-dependent methyltransferase [Phyllobacterium zundukense]PIO42387.1 SAM-dependent methyltransferase [Phyllobacterium zundukense]
MTRAFLPSGDLIADRRASYADMLFETGDHAAAADLMRQALEIVPGWTAGLFRLGEMEEAAGKGDAAAEAWRRVLQLDANDRFGAALKLAASGHATAPDTPPTAYVESLFDAYAPTFETALLDRLDYRVPELLAVAIKAAASGTHFRSALDLGCGTGLMGPYVRAETDHLAGMDLSEAMLQKAAEKQIYDSLAKGDVNQLDALPHSADLVIAADVFVYVGDLDRAFANVARILAPDGLFAFSVENHAGEDELILQPSLRYTHSERYVRRLLAEHSMTPLSVGREAIRLDRGEPLQGLIVVAKRLA